MPLSLSAHQRHVLSADGRPCQNNQYFHVVFETDCIAQFIVTKWFAAVFIPTVASVVRWLCVKQSGHHDGCRAHASRRVGHPVLSVSAVALHQTAIQEIHLRAASPR